MPKIKVKVKPEIFQAGSGFHDFESKANIYPKKADQVFEVEDTAFIRRKIHTGELILVTEKKSESPKSDDKPK